MTAPTVASLTAQVAELEARIGALEGRVQRYMRIRDLLDGADQQPSFTQPKPKRDRHGLRGVK